MKKILFIIASIATMFGLSYYFIKPTFKVDSIDGMNQKINFQFDGKSGVYQSGLGLGLGSSSRSYDLDIKDEVVTIGGIAVSGSILVTITQFGKLVQTYTIRPKDYGFYIWNWKK